MRAAPISDVSGGIFNRRPLAFFASIRPAFFVSIESAAREMAAQRKPLEAPSAPFVGAGNNLRTVAQRNRIKWKQSRRAPSKARCLFELGPRARPRQESPASERGQSRPARKQRGEFSFAASSIRRQSRQSFGDRHRRAGSVSAPPPATCCARQDRKPSL